MTPFRCIFAALLPNLALAQAPVWQLDLGSAVIYRVRERLEHHAVDDPHTRFAFPDSNGPQVPILLASELAPDRRSVAAAPVDLRAMVSSLAFDLQQMPRGGAQPMLYAALAPFGKTTLTGKWWPCDADGRQRGEWQVTALATLGRPDLKGRRRRDNASALSEPTNLGAAGKGTLVIDRQYDPVRGVVLSFAAELHLTGRPCPRYSSLDCTEVVMEMHWDLDRVVPHRAPGFQTEIDAAVQAGARWVRHEIAIPNRNILAADKSNSAGTLAIALLTLLAAEVPVNDAVVAQGLAELRRREIRETYELALALCALERAHAPPRERDLLITGGLTKLAPRVLDESELADARGWTQRLLGNRDSYVDRGYRSRWRYNGGAGYDNSNTQYALLGLRSASLCGVTLSRQVWHGAAAHWLEGMSDPEPVRPLILTHHAQAKSASLGEVAKRSARLIAPRGWSYGNEAPTPYGNMVSAGIASLVLCREALAADKQRNRPAELGEIDQAIDSGFAWWSAHRTVRRVPSDDQQRWSQHYLYGLYGLERACELAGVAWIDDWDWYSDGAHMLLLMQQPDGSFSRSLADTCFATLFLKKALLPVLTGPRNSTLGGR